MTLILSILAILISIGSILIPIFDKDFRRGYMFSKNMKGIKHYQREFKHYSYHSIPLSWIGTAYHIKQDLMNYATHTLDMYYLEQKQVSEAIFYVSLKDFQSVSDGTYKLLIEDPFGEVWTHYAELDRFFIEDNLDKIIRIEAEIVSKESNDGIAMFHPDSKLKNLINPLKVEATGIPTLIIDVDKR